MADMQRTLDGQLVPVGPHRDDIVKCSDGSTCRREDAVVDCAGGFHYDEEDRHEADVQIVTDLLDGIDEWICEYCTTNTDYADGYAHIVDELSHDWRNRVEDWVENKCHHHDICPNRVNKLIEHVYDALKGSFDSEPEYDGNEYACYYGDGCCLASFDIGEYEEQIEINSHDELQVLHDEGRLDDVLDDVNCEMYISRSRRREKNEETGRCEQVGRETYMPYTHDAEHPCLMGYTMPGGQWHWVVSAERMNDLLDEAYAELYGDEDCDDD